MGRDAATRADTLRGGENKGRDPLRQILDDPRARGAAELGQYGGPPYAHAEEEPLPRYD